MIIKVSELSPDHRGYQIKVLHPDINHVEGILKWYMVHDPDYTGTNIVDILAQKPDNSYVGSRFDLDTEIEIEKTLEEQVKDDLRNLRDQATANTIKWLRKRFN